VPSSLWVAQCVGDMEAKDKTIEERRADIAGRAVRLW
jgi:hypothetical protein